MTADIFSENEKGDKYWTDRIDRETDRYDSPTSNPFNNLYGELDFYKKKCDVLENDVQKLQTNTKKLESALKQVQEINVVNAKVR